MYSVWRFLRSRMWRVMLSFPFVQPLCLRSSTEDSWMVTDHARHSPFEGVHCRRWCLLDFRCQSRLDQCADNISSWCLHLLKLLVCEAILTRLSDPTLWHCTMCYRTLDTKIRNQQLSGVLDLDYVLVAHPREPSRWWLPEKLIRVSFPDYDCQSRALCLSYTTTSLVASGQAGAAPCFPFVSGVRRQAW